jgi:para-aminobenzoate synthetase
MRILLVDHQDSFAFNLVHGFGEVTGERPRVLDSTAPGATRVWQDLRSSLGGLDLVVLGPGPGNPGNPRDAGLSFEVLDRVLGRVPVFGVCLGLQLLVAGLGGRIRPAAAVVHGKSLPLTHDGLGLFRGIPSPVGMMRYHSLVADPARLPPELRVTAWSEDREIMALEHSEAPAWAVQFHPESVGSPLGKRLLRNVVDAARRSRTRAAGT